MGMTKRESAAKDQIMEKLYEEGYGSNSKNPNKITYSQLLNCFDIHLTKDPDTVAYVEFNKGVITINENLDIDQVSFIIRHEILHEFLDHFIRMEKHLMQLQGVSTPEEIDWSKADHEMQNFAADWELSNRGYTDKDKRTAKHIRIGEREVKGLVTEIDRPEWVDLSMEEMYDKLMEEKEEFKEKLRQYLKNNPQLDKPGNQEIQDLEELQRLADILKEMADEKEKGGGGGSGPQGPVKTESDDYVEGYNQLIDDLAAGKFTKEELKDYYNKNFGGAVA